jgi:hypothetical protein
MLMAVSFSCAPADPDDLRGVLAVSLTARVVKTCGHASQRSIADPSLLIAVSSLQLHAPNKDHMMRAVNKQNRVRNDNARALRERMGRFLTTLRHTGILQARVDVLSMMSLQIRGNGAGRFMTQIGHTMEFT